MNIFSACLALSLLYAIPGQAQQHLLKLATLAPEGSSWVKAIRAIDAEVRQQTQGAVGFKIYPGGVQGDEDVMLRKMRVGQLHAGGFAGMGLSKIQPDILALEMPFLFEEYAEIDYVLDKTHEYYTQGFAKQGYVMLGWVDIGFVHILSQKPVRGVKDIQGRKVWRLESDPITASLFKRAKVNSVPLTIPDVLLGLQTNLVDVVYAPPAAAIVLQWFTRVKCVSELPINYTLGALLVGQKHFDRLSADHQQALRQISARHLRQLTLQSRQENSEAFDVMRGQGLQIVSPDPEEVASFRQLVQDSKADLVGEAFSQEAYDLVLKHLSAYRQQAPPTTAPGP